MNCPADLHRRIDDVRQLVVNSYLNQLLGRGVFQVAYQLVHQLQGVHANSRILRVYSLKEIQSPQATVQGCSGEVFALDEKLEN